MKKENLYLYLSYLGTIPFFLCTLLIHTNIQFIPYIGSVEHILSLYALTIANFMSGSLWGQQFVVKGVWGHTLLPIFSNIIAITLWMGFICLKFSALMIMFCSIFLVLLWIDFYLFKFNAISKRYFQTRCIISIGVIFCLITSMLKLH